MPQKDELRYPKDERPRRGPARPAYDPAAAVRPAQGRRPAARPDYSAADSSAAGRGGPSPRMDSGSRPSASSGIAGSRPDGAAAPASARTVYDYNAETPQRTRSGAAARPAYGTSRGGSPRANGPAARPDYGTSAARGRVFGPGAQYPDDATRSRRSDGAENIGSRTHSADAGFDGSRAAGTHRGAAEDAARNGSRGAAPAGAHRAQRARGFSDDEFVFPTGRGRSGTGFSGGELVNAAPRAQQNSGSAAPRSAGDSADGARERSAPRRPAAKQKHGFLAALLGRGKKNTRPGGRSADGAQSRGGKQPRGDASAAALSGARAPGRPGTDGSSAVPARENGQARGADHPRPAAPHGLAGRLAAFFRRSAARRRTKREQQAGRPLSLAAARRQRIRKRILTGLVAAAALAAGIFLSINVLFKIETITLEGDLNGYTEQEVLTAFGQKKGSPLFGFDARKTGESIVHALPYLETASIRRHLPSRVTITVTPAAETYAVNSASGWVALSKSLRVMRISSDAPTGLVLLQGAEADNPVSGDTVAFTDPAQLLALQTLCTQLDAQGIAPVTEIDLTDTLELNFLYDNRIRVELGTTNELDLKLAWAKALIVPGGENSLGETDTGTLDVSTRNEDGRLQGVWRAGKL